MKVDDRKAGDYIIRNALQIGGREVVIGENAAAEPGQRYMTAYCQMFDVFAKYDEVLVSDDYAEIVQIFGERIAECAKQVQRQNADFKVDKTPIDMGKCDSVTVDTELEGRIIVIKADVFRPEYAMSVNQIQLCTGGFGARPNSRGSACYCRNLYSGKESRFERRDVLGILKPENMPDWAKQNAEIMTSPTQKKMNKEAR